MATISLCEFFYCILQYSVQNASQWKLPRSNPEFKRVLFSEVINKQAKSQLAEERKKRLKAEEEREKEKEEKEMLEVVLYF